jgi:hypothetical protein
MAERIQLNDDTNKSISERLANMKSVVKQAEQLDNLTAAELSKLRQIETLQTKLENFQKRNCIFK